MKDLLKKYNSITKNITQFHNFQTFALESILKGKNNLVIAPTGKGKSLIYQIGGQELDGITIVISPLVALIKEQAKILGSSLAITITSDIDFVNQRKILRSIAQGELRPKFIFLSPERLQNYFFRSALKKSGLKISMLVIDEAHCISQWGHDFRPEYSQIVKFIEYLKSVNQAPIVLAMTATIGAKPKQDIITEFKIEEGYAFSDENILRPELELNFIEVEDEKHKFQQILSLLEVHKPQKTIIYFYDIPNCKSFSQKLSQEGFSCSTYYSEMKGSAKDEVYESYKDGQIEILCATTAFGMGMNIPNIDMVIHHRLPNSIEEYYQQVGRAARDKSICPHAKCFLLWSEANFEFKFEEHVPSIIIELESIEDAFKKFGLTNQAGKPQSIEYSDYIAQGLGRIKFEFERHGLLKTIGELNGTPKTIELSKPNKRWEEIVTGMKYGNSFIRAAENAGMGLQELVDYVLEMELNGEIKKFPAMEKKIFIISDYNQVPIDISYKIVSDSIILSQFKEVQINKLIELIKSKDPQGYIKQYFREIIGKDL